MPLGTSTILEHLLRGMARSGISEATISLGYLGHLVRAVIGDGAGVGVNAEYTTESSPLGTAGPLRLLSHLDDDDIVLVVNGDTWTDFDFASAVRALDERNADAILVCTERTTRIDFGVVQLDASDSLAQYVEKPTMTHLVSTGINAIRGSTILNWLPEGRVDMPDFLQAVQSAGGTVSCLQTDASWRDLGRPDDLIAANEEYA